jgi:hypothetical protein
MDNDAAHTHEKVRAKAKRPAIPNTGHWSRQTPKEHEHGTDPQRERADGRQDSAGRRWHRRHRQGDRRGPGTMGAYLALCGRDRRRAEGAAGEIRAAGGGQVDVLVADLSCQSEVRRLADEIPPAPFPDRCAGQQRRGYWNTRHVTADGAARLWQVSAALVGLTS